MWRHMMRLSVIALVLVMVATAVPSEPATVQAGGRWSAWLYNQDSGQLAEAYPDGIAGWNGPFPMVPGMSGYPYQMAFSDNGQYVATCQSVMSMGGMSLFVSEPKTANYLGGLGDSSPTIDCMVTSASFISDGSPLVAYGILWHFPDPADPSPDWEIRVVDPTVPGGVSPLLYSLTSNSPVMGGLGLNLDGKMPMIRSYEPGVIAFTLLPWGTEGPQETPGLVWQLESGFVGEIGPYGKGSLDLLAQSGEAVWVDENPAFPSSAHAIFGMGYPYNTAMYSNKAGAWHAIFTMPDVVVNTVAFINNGQAVAVSTSDAVGTKQWWMVDRAGTVSSLPVPADVYRVIGVTDGYIFMDSDGGDTGGQAVKFHQMTGGTFIEQRIWQGALGEYWQIVHVFPQWPVNPLPPFPEVSPPANTPQIQIAPTQSLQIVPTQGMPQIQIAPTQPSIRVVATQGMPPIRTAVLTIGNMANVNTTEGDVLRVRSGPGTGFGVSFQLVSGTPVTLLDGPRAADGYDWWFVQASDGRTGWAVAGVNDSSGWIDTLVPIP